MVEMETGIDRSIYVTVQSKTQNSNIYVSKSRKESEVREDESDFYGCERSIGKTRSSQIESIQHH